MTRNVTLACTASIQGPFDDIRRNRVREWIILFDFYERRDEPRGTVYAALDTALLIAALKYRARRIRARQSAIFSFLTSATYIFLNSRDVTNAKARRKEVSACTSSRSCSSLILVLLGDRLEIDSRVCHVGRHGKLVHIDQTSPPVRNENIPRPTLINSWRDWLILWLTALRTPALSSCVRARYELSRARHFIPDLKLFHFSPFETPISRQRTRRSFVCACRVSNKCIEHNPLIRE